MRVRRSSRTYKRMRIRSFLALLTVGALASAALINTACSGGSQDSENAGATSEAIRRPCPPIGGQVCGVNAVTYTNACVAEQAGEAVAYEGACVPEPRPCHWTTFDAGACYWNEYCATPPGSCGQSGSLDVDGICTALPTSCPPTNAPVCGCDNKVYPSPCAAAMALVPTTSMDHCE
jgi:hypothetical protein